MVLFLRRNTYRINSIMIRSLPHIYTPKSNVTLHIPCRLLIFFQLICRGLVLLSDKLPLKPRDT